MNKQKHFSSLSLPLPTPPHQCWICPSSSGTQMASHQTGQREGSQLCLFINKGPRQGRDCSRVGDSQRLPAPSRHPKWGVEAVGHLLGKSFGPPASPPHAMGCHGGRAPLICPHHHIWARVAETTPGTLVGEIWVVLGARDPCCGGAAEGRMSSLVGSAETSLSALVFHLQTEEDLRKVLETYALRECSDTIVTGHCLQFSVHHLTPSSVSLW